MCIYISTHFLTSQPTLIKLDNENIGGHLTPLQGENVTKCDSVNKYASAHLNTNVMLPNRTGMAGLIPCPGRGSFCPGNVKIDHRAWIYGCSLVSVLYFVLCLSVTHDLT